MLSDYCLCYLVSAKYIFHSILCHLSLKTDILASITFYQYKDFYYLYPYDKVVFSIRYFQISNSKHQIFSYYSYKPHTLPCLFPQHRTFHYYFKTTRATTYYLLTLLLLGILVALKNNRAKEYHLQIIGQNFPHSSKLPRQNKCHLLYAADNRN